MRLKIASQFLPRLARWLYIEEKGKHRMNVPISLIKLKIPAAEIGMICCEKCGFPLAWSLGRSLVLGAVILRASVRLECSRCNWGRWWYPAAKERQKHLNGGRFFQGASKG
jgi:hypothetical protein